MGFCYLTEGSSMLVVSSSRGTIRPATFRTSGYYFLGLLVVAIVAFWPSYFGRELVRIDSYTHFHVAMMLLWFGLLIAQPFLIRRGMLPVHRRLGSVSYLLAPVIVVSGLLLSHSRLNRLDAAEFRDFGHFFFLAVQATLLFAATWSLAMIFRRKAALHARFMVGTALTLIDPVVARLLGRFPPVETEHYYQIVGFGLTDILLLILILADRRSGKGRAAFPAMLAMFAALHMFWFTGAQSGWWLRFVTWFRDLPLT